MYIFILDFLYIFIVPFIAGLTWQDINLEEQYLTVRRSVRYNGTRHKTEIGPTKRKKVRVVDFGDTLAEILKKAKKGTAQPTLTIRTTVPQELLQGGAGKEPSFLQVKTVQMGKYEDYDKTNKFYISLGFKEFEIFPTLWDEANPCQIYVMSLK